MFWHQNLHDVSPAAVVVCVCVFIATTASRISWRKKKWRKIRVNILCCCSCYEYLRCFDYDKMLFKFKLCVCLCEEGDFILIIMHTQMPEFIHLSSISIHLAMNCLHHFCQMYLSHLISVQQKLYTDMRVFLCHHFDVMYSKQTNKKLLLSIL